MRVCNASFICSDVGQMRAANEAFVNGQRVSVCSVQCAVWVLLGRLRLRLRLRHIDSPSAIVFRKLVQSSLQERQWC